MDGKHAHPPTLDAQYVRARRLQRGSSIVWKIEGPSGSKDGALAAGADDPYWLDLQAEVPKHIRSSRDRFARPRDWRGQLQ